MTLKSALLIIDLDAWTRDDLEAFVAEALECMSLLEESALGVRVGADCDNCDGMKRCRRWCPVRRLERLLAKARKRGGVR